MEETRWNVKSLQKGIDKLVEEIDGIKLDNELKKRTIDSKVKESALTLQNLMAEILVKGSQRKVNEEEAKAIPTEILQGWEKLVKEGKALINQREQTEAYRDWETDRKSTRLNSSHSAKSRMPSSA